MPLVLAAATPEASPWGTLLFLAFVGASLIVWATLIQRWIQRRPVVEFTPRRPVPWNWVWALSALLIYLIANMAALEVVRAVVGGQLVALGGDNPRDMMLLLGSTAIAGVVSTWLTVLILTTACGATRSDLGLDPAGLGRDVLYGVAGFLAVTPIVFFIKWLLLPFSEENHPLEKLAREHPTPTVLLSIVVVAVVIAPWVEEFLLRVVFQGWLERCFFRQPIDARLAPEDDSSVAWGPIAHDLADPADPVNPYAAPSLPPSSAMESAVDSVADPGMSHAESAPPTGIRAAMPIVISSVVFAAMHIGHGIDPIPLFVLALVLGWLYQRTHRLWPSVALHTALNATSVAMLIFAT